MRAPARSRLRLSVAFLTLLASMLLAACGGGPSTGGGGSGGGGNGGGGGGKTTTPPAQPTDITPLNGETYYLVNQLSGLQADLINQSTTAGDHVAIQSRSFTALSQRWALTSLSGGAWKISNLSNGLCLDSASSAGVTWVVQNPCTSIAT